MVKEFDNFVSERGEVSIKELKENFRSFTDDNVNLFASRFPKIINIGDGKFVHATHLNLYESDFEPLKNFCYIF